MCFWRGAAARACTDNLGCNELISPHKCHLLARADDEVRFFDALRLSAVSDTNFALCNELSGQLARFNKTRAEKPDVKPAACLGLIWDHLWLLRLFAQLAFIQIFQGGEGCKGRIFRTRLTCGFRTITLTFLKCAFTFALMAISAFAPALSLRGGFTLIGAA